MGAKKVGKRYDPKSRRIKGPKKKPEKEPAREKRSLSEKVKSINVKASEREEKDPTAIRTAAKGLRTKRKISGIEFKPGVKKRWMHPRMKELAGELKGRKFHTRITGGEEGAKGRSKKGHEQHGRGEALDYKTYRLRSKFARKIKDPKKRRAALEKAGLGTLKGQTKTTKGIVDKLNLRDITRGGGLRRMSFGTHKKSWGKPGWHMHAGLEKDFPYSAKKKLGRYRAIPAGGGAFEGVHKVKPKVKKYKKKGKK